MIAPETLAALSRSEQEPRVRARALARPRRMYSGRGPAVLPTTQTVRWKQQDLAQEIMIAIQDEATRRRPILLPGHAEPDRFSVGPYHVEVRWTRSDFGTYRAAISAEAGSGGRGPNENT